MTYWRYTFDYTDLELRQQHRPAHLEYNKQLAAQGKVAMAGPVLDQGGGMIVYHGTREEAEAAVAGDPYSLHGVSCNDELHEWTVVVGHPALLGEADGV